jgi:hypothetical protein
MSIQRPHPWDKQPAESEQLYIRFLMYRNLGPTRTLRKAWFKWLAEQDLLPESKEDQKKLQVSSTWAQPCALHKWAARAAAWDISNMTAYGSRTAVCYAMTMSDVSVKVSQAVKVHKPGDHEWTHILNTLRVLAEYLSPEVVNGIREGNAQLSRDFVQPTDGDTGTGLHAIEGGNPPPSDPDE